MTIDPFPNADKVGDLIESETDPVVRSVMRLVYGEFLTEIIAQTSMPEGAVDLLYCFRRIQSAFHRKAAVENAMNGDYGDPSSDMDWV